jgi:predicted permease
MVIPARRMKQDRFVVLWASSIEAYRNLLRAAKPAVFTGTFVKIVVQPAIFAVLLIVFGINNTAMGRETLVASAMPLATPCVLFAAQYKEFEAEAAALMLLTTLAMVVALPGGLFFSNYL